MLIYIIKSSVVLGILYSCYYVMLNKETLHHFNRMMLIAIMLLSLGLPLLSVTTEHPSTITTEISDFQSHIYDPIPVVVAHSIEPMATQQCAPSLGEVLEYIYIIGVALSSVVLLIQTSLLVLNMRGGLRHTDSRGNTVILQPGEVAPYSIFRYIVMSVDDYEHNRSYILTHEQEHIRLYHTYDLVLLEVVKILQWFNPFVWFLAANLKAVHEYEADEAVINQGIDAKQYQQLLVTKAVGHRLQPLANSLRRGSLKKRIIMMYQKKTNRWMMLKALFVLPVAALTITAFATPSIVNDADAKPDDTSLSTKTDEQATTSSLQAVLASEHEVAVSALGGDDKIYTKVDVLPEFPGGAQQMMVFLMKNLKYPKVALEMGIQGREIVSFVVEKDGTLTNFQQLRSATEGFNAKSRAASNANVNNGADATAMKQAEVALYEESVRVLQSMPKWKPGKNHGKVVRSKFCIPVTFRLN